MTAGRVPIGILGGTFDPVHVGHVAVARAARQALGLDGVWLVPTRQPPHRPRPPYTSIYHRFAMTALAALSTDGLRISDLELDTPGPSYTALLLERLHAEGYEAWQIVFIIGADAFAEIATWHQYPAILDRCHFAVISRPGQDADEAPASSATHGLGVTGWAARLPHLATRFVQVAAASRGRDARSLVASRQPSIFLIDVATPDVSSTEIRERLRAGLPIADMVPATVADYIQRHALYAGDVSTAGHLHEHTSQ